METGKYKPVVVYYSLSGRTRRVAEYISRKFGIDTIEIVSKKEYPKQGAKVYLIGGYDVIKKRTPEIEDIDVTDYDLVLLGTPVWAGTFAPPVRTLIESGKLNDKKIGYFYTHNGGAMSASNRIEETGLDIVSTLSIANVKEELGDIKPLVLNWVTEIIKDKEK